MVTETLRPDGDSATGGWTDQAGGASGIYATLDEATQSDSDYVRSPVRTVSAVDLTVRLMQGGTQIAAWSHNDVPDTYATAEQTLTAPQVAAITNYANLFLEFDDGAGSVYRCSMGNPAGGMTAPVVVRYRFKRETAVEEVGGGDSAAYTNFIARTSGLDSAHLAAYKALLDGLTTDGLFNASGSSIYLDCLWVTATQNLATVRLNLVANRNSLVDYIGAPTFTVDQGTYGTSFDTGLDTLNAGLNGNINSLSYGVWNNSSGIGDNYTPFSQNTGDQCIYPNYVDGNSYYRNKGDVVVANGAAASWYASDRLATAMKAYKNGVLVGSGTSNPVGMGSGDWNIGGTDVVLAAYVGAAMSATQHANLHARLHTYMQAIVKTIFSRTPLTGSAALSNGGLTVTGAGTGGWCTVPALGSARAGKFYCEFQPSVIPVDGWHAVGIAQVNETGGHLGVGGGPRSIGWFANGQVWMNGGAVYAASPYAITHWIGMAVDIPARRIFFKNITTAGTWNNAGADPVAGVGGFDFSAMTLLPFAAAVSLGYSAVDSTTANFGATPYQATPPAGFGNWII